MAERGPRPEDVHRVTAAPRSRSEDQQARIKRYLTSMAIRTVCVILAVVVSGPLRWVFIVGAVLLPYIAVVMANAAGAPRDPQPGVTAPAPAPATRAGADRMLPPEQRVHEGHVLSRGDEE